MEKIKQGWMDRKINKWISRKLAVFGLGTWLLYVDKISGEQWVALALAYVGVEGIAKIAAMWKHGPFLN